MPTGYTACIDDGGSFADYVWSCARAMFREGEVEEPKVEPYYAEAVERYKKRLAELEAQDPHKAYNEWFETQTRQNAEYLAKNKAVREKYQQMRMLVADWQPPTLKHSELKKLMLEQIGVGCETDMTAYYENQPTPQDPFQWHFEQIQNARSSLRDSEERLQKHIQWVEAGKKWLAALEQSVPRPEKK